MRPRRDTGKLFARTVYANDPLPLAPGSYTVRSLPDIRSQSASDVAVHLQSLNGVATLTDEYENPNALKTSASADSVADSQPPRRISARSDPEIRSIVALTSTVPSAAALRRPSRDTVATAGFEDCHRAVLVTSPDPPSA